MDVSIKKLLKAARECLQKKEYQEVLAHCKAALKEDKSCYEAYVFVGKAAFHLQEYQQAEAAYTRATGLDPANLMAWQGLAELHTESGAWAKAYDAFDKLSILTSASPDAAIAARAAGFKRKAAEAAVQAGLLDMAVASWQELLSTSSTGAAQLELLCRLADTQLAVEDVQLQQRVEALSPQLGDGVERDVVEAEWAQAGLDCETGSAAATIRQIMTVAPPSPAYAHYYELYIQRLRMAAHGAPVGTMERHSRRATVLSAAMITIRGLSSDGTAGGCCLTAPFEVALAMLEVEGNVACTMTSRVTSQLPGSPRMEDVLTCSSPVPFAMPSPINTSDLGLHQVQVSTPSHGGAQEGLGLQLVCVEQVAKRLAHAFPWTPAAAVHLALCSRRRAQGVAVRHTAQYDPDVTDLNLGRPAPGRCKRLSAGTRRRKLIKLLVDGLRRGVPSFNSASGWLAASEMLLDEGKPDAALDAAKQGLAYLTARELLGHEALVQADLLLKLAAGRAMAAMAGVPPPGPSGYTMHMFSTLLALAQYRPEVAARLDKFPLTLRSRAARNTGAGAARDVHAVNIALEAGTWLSGLLLSGRVGGGPAPFARLSGSTVAEDLVPQATRCLAQLSLSLGDVSKARELYEGLVGAAAMGRVDPTAMHHWASAEYASLLAAHGEWVAATCQLDNAIRSLTASPPVDETCPEQLAVHSLLEARYHLLAGHVCWELGGKLRSTRGSGAHQHLLSAAAAAEAAAARSADHDLSIADAARLDAAAAFGLLGTWYLQCAQDESRAVKCFHRALSLDPAQEAAGEALAQVLLRSGGDDTTPLRQLCQECISRSLQAGSNASAPPWAVRHLAAVQVQTGEAEHAMAAVQQALRGSPRDVALWELLGAAYQQLGRQSAALRAYTRAVELSPQRLYSLIQLGVLHHQQAAFPDAMRAFSRALKLQPHHPAALLGAAECQLAIGVRHAADGAHSLATTFLQQAAEDARTCTTHHGHMQAGWKLLGDILLQHADVTPAAALPARDARGPGFVSACTAGLQGRVASLRSATRAYAATLHLNPMQGHVWGDVGMATHQAAMTTLVLDTLPAAPASATPSTWPAPEIQLHLAGRLVQGGLRLEPASDALWQLAGDLAASRARSLDLQAAAKEPAGANTTHHVDPNTTVLGAAAHEQPAAGQLMARAEFCLSRALQLNSGRGPAWAALSRLYAHQGNYALAAAAAERCRLVDPRLVAVWEAMAALSGSSCKGFGDVGYKEQLDAWEHAVGLGGGAESWLGYATGGVVVGEGSAAQVMSTALRATSALPLSPAAHNTFGLCQEARQLPAQAAQAYETALAVLKQQQTSRATQSVTGGGTWVLDTIPQLPAAQAASSAEVAVQLNLARALVRDKQYQQAVQMYRQIETDHGSAVMGKHPSALVALGFALIQTGEAEGGVRNLEAALKVARDCLQQVLTSSSSDVSSTTLAWRQMLGCTQAVVHGYLSHGRPAEALQITRQACQDMPHGNEHLAKLGSQLWLVLLVAAHAQVSAQLSAQEIEQELEGWARSRADVDAAMIKAQVHDARAAAASAATNLKTALTHAAHAYHTCPWHPHWRLRLAATAASQAGGAYTRSCVRLAPSPSPPTSADQHTAQGDASTRHLPLSTFPVGGMAPLPAPPGPSTTGSLIPTLSSSPSQAGDACGYTLQAGGVLAAQPAAQLPRQQVQEVVRQLVRLVHVAPCEPGALYLLALLSLQLAVDSGQSSLYRTALLRSQVALAHAQRVLSHHTARGSSGGGAGGEVQQAEEDGLAGSASAGTGTTAGDKEALQACVLRLLIAISEAALHSRMHGCVQHAKGAATDALRWALQQGLNPGPAHRQLARIAAASHDLPNAELAASQAWQSGDVPALIELAHLSRGSHIPGVQQALSNLQAEQVAVPDRQLAASCQLLHVSQQMQAGDLSGARQSVISLIQDHKLPDAAQAAAYVVQSRVAACLAAARQGQADGSPDTPPLTTHQLSLEAKWAANAALKHVSCMVPVKATQAVSGSDTADVSAVRPAEKPMASPHPTRCLAASCLAAAELLLGKVDKASAAMSQARLHAPSSATSARLQVACLRQTGSEGSQQLLRHELAAAVHINPTAPSAWRLLAHTAAAAAS